MLNRDSFYFLTALLLIFSLPGYRSAQGEKKIAYGILIDNTGSMRSQLNEVLMIAKGIIEQAHPRGPISLFNFETQTDKKKSLALVTSGTEWSQDDYLMDSYIDALFVVPGQTVLLDSINSIADRLDAKTASAGDAFGGKVIFLITDGEERESKIKEKQLVERLKKSGIKVYAVGLVNELGNRSGIISKSSRSDAVKLLEKIAAETGGRAVFPNSKETDVGGLLKELFAKPIP